VNENVKWCHGGEEKWHTALTGNGLRTVLAVLLTKMLYGELMQ
jgi:hypothetical protein